MFSYTTKVAGSMDVNECFAVSAGGDEVSLHVSKAEGSQPQRRRFLNSRCVSQCSVMLRHPRIKVEMII